MSEAHPVPTSSDIKRRLDAALAALTVVDSAESTPTRVPDGELHVVSGGWWPFGRSRPRLYHPGARYRSGRGVTVVRLSSRAVTVPLHANQRRGIRVRWADGVRCRVWAEGTLALHDPLRAADGLGRNPRLLLNRALDAGEAALRAAAAELSTGALAADGDGMRLRAALGHRARVAWTTTLEAWGYSAREVVITALDDFEGDGDGPDPQLHAARRRLLALLTRRARHLAAAETVGRTVARLEQAAAAQIAAAAAEAERARARVQAETDRLARERAAALAAHAAERRRLVTTIVRETADEPGSAAAVLVSLVTQRRTVFAQQIAVNESLLESAEPDRAVHFIAWAAQARRADAAAATLADSLPNAVRALGSDNALAWLEAEYAPELAALTRAGELAAFDDTLPHPTTRQQQLLRLMRVLDALDRRAADATRARRATVAHLGVLRQIAARAAETLL